MTPSAIVCKMQNWYPLFSAFTFPTCFVPLSPMELKALIAGKKADAPEVATVLPRLRKVMADCGNSCFISVDALAPKDTARFRGSKRGAIHSAESAWNTLAESKRIREAADRGEVTTICVRMFRVMDMEREFRMFIKKGRLYGMSQYWTNRYFPHLEKKRFDYWHIAWDFVEAYNWLLPAENIVIDIYITSAGEIIVLDLNPFGKVTDPLMFRNWNVLTKALSPIGMALLPDPAGGDKSGK